MILQLRSGELDAKRGNALIYAYSTLASVIAGSDVEKRLAALETAVKKPAPPWAPPAAPFPTGQLLGPLPSLPPLPTPPLRFPGPETEQ